jgi:hypothetical protein
VTEPKKWEREKGIFASFLEAAPNFAGEPLIEWRHNQNHSPDIICTDRQRKTIGVEMTEWLHKYQTRQFSRWERVLRFVKIPIDWTIDVCLNLFGSDCEAEERREFAKELRIVVEIRRSRFVVVDVTMQR